MGHASSMKVCRGVMYHDGGVELRMCAWIWRGEGGNQGHSRVDGSANVQSSLCQCENRLRVVTHSERAERRAGTT
jgi:hypothetical protein